jgi:hypothetical protein
MAWTNIPNANLGVGSPVRSVDLLSIRDNIPAIANGDTGAPKIKNAAYDAGSITPDKLNGNQTGSAPAYVARAWVNFTGTGTVTILGSGNVSSITDGGTGSYTINFTTAMPDANYSFSGAGKATHDGSTQSLPTLGQYNSGTKTASALQVQTKTAGSNVDPTQVSVMVVR